VVSQAGYGPGFLIVKGKSI